MNLKISQFAGAGALTGNELIASEYLGDNYAISVDDILSYIESSHILGSGDGFSYLMLGPDGVTTYWENIFWDSSSNQSINYWSRILFDSSGAVSLDYNNRLMSSANGVDSINYDRRLFIDNFNQTSVDYNNRQEIDFNGFIANDWGNRGLVDADGTKSYDYGGRIFFDEFSHPAIKHTVSDRFLFDSSTVLSVDFGTRSICDGDGIPSINYATGQLLYGNAATSVDYRSGILGAADNTISMSYQDRILYDSSEGEVFRYSSPAAPFFNGGVNVGFNGESAPAQSIHITNAGTIQFDGQPSIAPTTSAISGLPANVFGASGNLLGEPHVWLQIVIDGTAYSVPAFAQ